MDAYLPIITKRASVRLRLDEINKLERVGRKVKVTMTDGGCEWTCTSIRELRGYLDSRFFPCLAGMIINFDKVRRMENLTVYFENGETAVMGRDGYVRTRQAFNAYMRGSNPEPEKSSPKEE